MARRHHYKRRSKELTELDVTTFLNLMVVLVPFLLITAVFSRIAIVELDLPASSGGSDQQPPEFRLEVVVREAGLELTNGTMVIATLPKVEDEYDLTTLGDYVRSLKEEYPDTEAASVLLEPQIEYDHLIQVMDVVRSVELPPPATDESDTDQDEPLRLALFPQISIGAAP